MNRRTPVTPPDPPTVAEPNRDITGRGFDWWTYRDTGWKLVDGPTGITGRFDQAAEHVTDALAEFPAGWFSYAEIEMVFHHDHPPTTNRQLIATAVRGISGRITWSFP